MLLPTGPCCSQPGSHRVGLCVACMGMQYRPKGRAEEGSLSWLATCAARALHIQRPDAPFLANPWLRLGWQARGVWWCVVDTTRATKARHEHSNIHFTCRYSVVVRVLGACVRRRGVRTGLRWADCPVPLIHPPKCNEDVLERFRNADKILSGRLAAMCLQNH